MQFTVELVSSSENGVVSYIHDKHDPNPESLKSIAQSILEISQVPKDEAVALNSPWSLAQFTTE